MAKEPPLFRGTYICTAYSQQCGRYGWRASAIMSHVTTCVDDELSIGVVGEKPPLGCATTQIVVNTYMVLSIQLIMRRASRLVGLVGGGKRPTESRFYWGQNSSIFERTRCVRANARRKSPMSTTNGDLSSFGGISLFPASFSSCAQLV